MHRSDEQVLLCHHCGYRRKMIIKCPQCGSEKVRHYGTGTQRVEKEVMKLIPGIRTMRWDYETTRKKDAHDFILNQFVARQADVLIGTQMLAKGLDLPFVTLVGVILADVGLNLPDFRAAERTFQVLTQVAGRAGRSPLGGEVILQSFQPGHYAIQAAAKHDYREFFQKELAYRRQLEYPPFTNLVRLEYRHLRFEQAQEEAVQMAARLKNWILREDRWATRIIGPVPCFFERAAGMYRWQILMKGPDPLSLLRDRALGDWRVAVNPPSIL
jgi:primosomal protein N' (replication factor Y)